MLILYGHINTGQTGRARQVLGIKKKNMYFRGKYVYILGKMPLASWDTQAAPCKSLQV